MQKMHPLLGSGYTAGLAPNGTYFSLMQRICASAATR